jgi:hypothetical protein
MSSYLVFAIAHSWQFPQLSLSKNVNWEFDLVMFWYQALWKHKDSHCFYEVFSGFVFVFKVLLLGEDPPTYMNRQPFFWTGRGHSNIWIITLS